MRGVSLSWGHYTVTFAAVMLLVAGCGKSKPEGAKPGEVTAKGAVKAEQNKANTPNNVEGAQPKGANKAAEAVDAPEAVTFDAARVAPSIKREDLQGLFDKWLAAQNDGDFEAYSKLYAARFMGVKRSGARTRSFKTETWLRDRKRMFSKAMKVEAVRVEMAATAESAVISFEQTWASGSYKDVGPKHLVVVRGDNGLQIAREEMLRSEVTSGESKHKQLSKDAFGFIVALGGSSWVVLDTRPKSSWAEGTPQLLSTKPYAVTSRNAKLGELPVESRRMLNREMRLLGPSGQVCRGHVDRIAIVSRVRPHFSTIGYWQGDEGGKPLPESKIAQEAWDLGDAGRLLVGRIKPVKANVCRGALWARDAEQPEPAIVGPKGGDPILIKTALTAFRKLKGYGEIQNSYLEMTNLPRPRFWDKFEGGAPKISILGSVDGKQKFIAMASQSGTGCGDFIGEYWAIWRVRGTAEKPQLVLMTDDRAPGRYFMPRSAVDVDGDGTLEFIGTDAVLQPVGAVVRESDGIEVPNLDCPC